MRRNRLWAVIGTLVIVAGLIVAGRHTVGRVMTEQILSVASGYHVSIGEMRLQRDHGAFLDVHVSKGSDPVLDADRIDLYYSLRDLLPGSSHRFGFRGISVARPRLTIVHHRDGSYNISQGRPGGNVAPGQTRTAGTPLDYFARVRDGSAKLVDQYTYYKEARIQTIRHINAVLSVKSDVRTHYVVAADFLDQTDQPLHAIGTIDYTRGFAMHHVVAKAVPIRTIANYFINSPAARFLSGSARNFEARMYALDVRPGMPTSYHIGAIADLADGALSIQGLARPLEHLRGVIRIFDGGLAARSLDATLAGVPLKVAGGIFNFSNPQFYFGVQGVAGLDRLKVLMPFAQHYPVSGRTQLQTLIEGPIAAPLVLIGFSSPLAEYQAIPIHNLRGVATLYNNVVSIVPLRARYGGVDVTAHGRLLLGKAVSEQIAVHFATNTDDVPYLGTLAPRTPIVGDAIVSGNDQNIGASGYLANARRATALSTFYDVTPRGYSTFGPISIASRNGTLYGGLVVDRPRGDSAFWISADNFPLTLARTAVLPGIAIPTLPPLQGGIDSANLAGGGNQDKVVVAGHIIARDAQVQGVPIDSLDATVGGPFTNLAITHLAVRAPWGRFDGDGGYAPNGLIARGTFGGRLESLARFVPIGNASGDAQGTVALAVGAHGVTVQAEDLRLTGAQIRGVPVQAATGTLAINGNAVHVYSALATVGGASTVAAGSFGNGGQLAVEAIDAGPQTAAALGLPLQAGSVSVAGTLGGTTAAPTFNGGVALSDGRVAGYPISGSSQVNFTGNAVQLSNATLTTAGMYGAVAGTIGGVRSGSPSYDLSANVPAGDIGSIAQVLHLPTYGTTGSFGADVHVGGRGTSPNVQGPFTVAAGQINGLNFGNAAAFLSASPFGVSVQGGHVDVGSTSARFSASVAGGSSHVSLNAPRADLSDFNDYFDTGDTLAGKGSVAVAFMHSATAISSSGNLNVRDFRYRRLPIGDTRAQWSSQNDVARGNVRVGGEHGILNAAGSIALASTTSGMRQMVERSRYNVSAHLRSLDLGTWLAALGYPTLPVTGRLNGDAFLRGRYPALRLSTTADLHDGTVGRIPIDRLQLAAHAAGSRIAISQIQAQIPALTASGSGSLGLGRRSPIAFDMRASSANLPMFLANFTHATLGISGALDTTLRVRGTFAAPTLTAGVDLTKGVIHGVAVPQLIAELSYSGRDILLRSAELTLQKGQITIAGALPFQISPLEIGPPDAPFSMDFFSRGVDVSDFQSLFPGGTTVSGLVDGRVGINGQVARPQIGGRLTLQNGSYVSDFETIPVTHTVGELTFAQTTAMLSGVHAQVGGGSLDASGRITFAGAPQRPVEYTLDATTKGAGLRFPAYGSGTVDSKIHLVKTVGLAKVSGNASVSNAVIPFATLIRGGGGADSESTGSGLPFNLAFDNFGVTARRNVAVRASAFGFGIDIGAHGNAVLGGTLAQPTLDGRFDSTGGTLTFVDHAFKIREGNVVFNPRNGIVPDLYAIGTTHVLNPDPNGARNPSGSADITITVTGPATSPQLAFNSNPPGYSRDQIIGMLTPLGAVTGIQFDEFGNPVPEGQLAGAPPVGNAQPLPPGAVLRTNGQVTVGQEAFNILNAQFARSLFTPVENMLGSGLGLSDVNVTLDYSGAVGFNFRKPISEKLYAVYATTFGYPSRQTYGFEYEPNALTAAQLAFFSQRQPVGFFSSATVISSNPRVTAGQPLYGSNGFTLTVQRLFW